MVCRPDAGPSARQRALLQAETASRLLPFRTEYQATLGMAQYRLGRYREAAETLERTIDTRSARGAEPDPADLAFLAMAQYRLGQETDAKATLGRLHALLHQPGRGEQEEANALRLEAEQVNGAEPAQNAAGPVGPDKAAGPN